MITPRHVPSTWNRTPSAALSVHLLDTSATKRVASSQRQCVASRSPWCCSTRSRRRTLTYSTHSFKYSRRAASTDSQGRSVDFRNTVLIMTSNLGTQDLRKANVGFTQDDTAMSYERMKEKVNDSLKTHFRPEFPQPHRRNHRLPRARSPRGASDGRHANGALGRTARGAGLGIELKQDAKELLADRGYDPTLGGRPLRRAIQRHIEDALSEKILYKEFSAGRDHRRRCRGTTLTKRATSGSSSPPSRALSRQPRLELELTSTEAPAPAPEAGGELPPPEAQD